MERFRNYECGWYVLDGDERRETVTVVGRRAEVTTRPATISTVAAADGLEESNRRLRRWMLDD